MFMIALLKKWKGMPTCGLLLAALLCGCSEPAPFDTTPVSGKVTYKDGSPINAKAVILRLMPQDKQTGEDSKFIRPAEGTLEPDGSFAKLSTIGKGDGAIPGLYTAIIAAYNEDTSPCVRAVAPQYRFQEQSPLKVEVKKGEKNHFILTVEKPR